MCCTEAAGAQQLRIDKLSRREKESQSTVNQLTVQIHELQDEVNSLNDARDFFDPETASSSGLFHVPSQLWSIPSPRGMISRDSCLHPDIRNSLGISGNVFEDPPAKSEPPAAFVKYGISTMRTSASEHRETCAASK